MSTEYAAQPTAPARARTSGDSYDDIEPALTRLAALEPDDPARARLRADIIARALPLGDHIARRYSGRGVDHEDLAQVAALAVVLSVDRFDPAVGASFLGFAIPTIMGEVKRYFRDTGWAVRVPRRTKEVHLKITRGAPVLAQRLGREPTARELADYLEVDLGEVTQALIARHSYQTESLDSTGSDTDEAPSSSVAHTFGDVDPGYALMEDTLTAGPLLALLSERDRDILTMRFGQEMTQAEIAKALGCSQMQVSRILTRVLQELREKALQPA
ncbi:SigB/SigF/SigG family RNA polymerase sigma factor [Nocardia jejuensis]|uniref:SigB/SigF/SigG family RNA polymerase sigma factor n=1 Tax=Nocardia jejuensis TaxID=328049 RepID=UPI00082E002F|nr:SigB/SigF/SigG family RNA polymerase sigma factor [Nocardia jejuensis]